MTKTINKDNESVSERFSLVLLIFRMVLEQEPLEMQVSIHRGSNSHCRKLISRCIGPPPHFLWSCSATLQVSLEQPEQRWSAVFTQQWSAASVREVWAFHSTVHAQKPYFPPFNYLRTSCFLRGSSLSICGFSALKLKSMNFFRNLMVANQRAGIDVCVHCCWIKIPAVQRLWYNFIWDCLSWILNLHCDGSLENRLHKIDPKDIFILLQTWDHSLGGYLKKTNCSPFS